ncbi:MAG: LysM peptidoglycan-binding domain-containing protein [Dehalobacterium sp.]
MKKLSWIVILGLLIASMLPTIVFGENNKGNAQSSNLTAVTIYLAPGDISGALDADTDTGLYYTYVVKTGDNLGRIAESFCTTVQKLMELNKLSDPNVIYVGHELKVRSAAKSSEPVIYTVQSGDTMSKIAQKNGLAIPDIVKANNLQNPNILYIGEKIVIPAKQIQPAAQGIKTIYIIYAVRPGDTLFKIARENSTTVDEIIKANNLNPNKYLFVGQKIAIPKKGTIQDHK